MHTISSILKRIKSELRLIGCNRKGFGFNAGISAVIAFSVILICGCGGRIYNRASIRIPSVMPARFILNVTFILMIALAGAALYAIITGGWMCRKGNGGICTLNMLFSGIFLLLWYPLFFSADAFFLAIISLCVSAFFAYITLKETTMHNLLLLTYIILLICYDLMLIVSNIIYIFIN